MSDFSQIFPELASTIEKELRANQQSDLADQIRKASIKEVTFDNGANAGYVYFKPSWELSAIEKSTICVRHEETISIEGAAYPIYLDVDNLRRLTGVEVLSPPGTIKSKLRQFTRSKM